MLDPRDGETVEISPAALGDNPWARTTAPAIRVNPVTGLPYAPDVVPRADFARVLAEFWADGPTVGDAAGPLEHDRQRGHRLTRLRAARSAAGARSSTALEWDVKMYLALNGAVHDAAVAAWGCKGHYDTVRPISMIRYMGGQGQSSDPAGPVLPSRGPPLGTASSR